MIDINYLRENREEAKLLFKRRKCDVNVDEFLALNDEFNTKKSKLDNLKFEQKNSSIERAKEIKKEISSLKDEVSLLEKKRDDIWLTLPNILAPDTPDGESDADNVEIKKCGNLPVFNFEPKSHSDLGKQLEILDLERGA